MPEEENKILEMIPFNDNPDIEKRFAEHWDLFIKYRDSRNQTIRFFNKNGVARNIIDYVEDGVDRMNERKIKPFLL